MKKILFLFDVDGTLTYPGLKMSKEMVHQLDGLGYMVDIAIVTGADQEMIERQITKYFLESKFAYCFYENASTVYQKKELLKKIFYYRIPRRRKTSKFLERGFEVYL